jgi:hypothetical protein
MCPTEVSILLRSANCRDRIKADFHSFFQVPYLEGGTNLLPYTLQSAKKKVVELAFIGLRDREVDMKPSTGG